MLSGIVCYMYKKNFFNSKKKTDANKTVTRFSVFVNSVRIKIPRIYTMYINKRTLSILIKCGAQNGNKRITFCYRDIINLDPLLIKKNNVFPVKI